MEKYEDGAMLRIKLSQIVVNPNAMMLRGADEENVDFQDLKLNIAKNGVLTPISVQPYSEVGGVQTFTLVDGTQRYTAARDIGLKEINAVVRYLSPVQLMAIQISANKSSVPTTKFQFAQGLRFLLNSDQAATVEDIATANGWQPQWVGKILNLNKLDPEVGKFCDDNNVSAANMAKLTELPAEQQKKYMTEAVKQPYSEFAGTVKNLKAQAAAERKAQGNGTVKTFEAQPHLRKRAEIDAQHALAKDGKSPFTTVAEAFDWLLHLDAAAVAEAKAKWDKMQADAADKAAKREQEKRDKAAAVLAGGTPTAAK